MSDCDAPRPGLLPDSWDVRNTDSEFKYRVWLTWRLIKSSLKDIPYAETVARRQKLFWMAVSRMNPNEDLWLWEDEDEEYIKGFAETSFFDPKLIDISEVEWVNACRALEARQLQHPRTASPVSHLSPQTRLRLMAWLIPADVHPKEWRAVKRPGLNQRADLGHLIRYWRISITDSIADHQLESCAALAPCCGVPDGTRRDVSRANVDGTWHSPFQEFVSRDLLEIWLETMLQVYSVDDLGQSIQWHHQCTCFHDRLAARSVQFSGMDIRPERNSVMLRVLFELIVSPWPLILWVAFRTMARDQQNPVQTFLSILRGPDHDLFVWDLTDHSDLLRDLLDDSRLALYPRDWNEYMAELDFITWEEIRKTTQTDKGLRFKPDDLKIRLGAASLLFPTALRVPQIILAPLHITLDRFPFTIMARVVKTDYKEHPVSGNFESKEFWAHSNLENWLWARVQDFCHAIWHTPSDMTTSERVQAMHLVLTAAVENFLPMYTYYLSRTSMQRSGPWDLKFLSLMQGGFFESLINYRLESESLFRLLKDRQQSVENGSGTAHTTSTDVYRHMNLRLSVAVAGLVFFLQDRKSYNQFLTYRGGDAQTLLDLLQDFLDLDFFSVVKPFIFKALSRLSLHSGLNPRCFSLTELQTVGQQVAGGGFGDIWKGLVRGQTVCVKIMRIFQNDDVQALFKEFGREALIWRQLHHPNLLPFFGLYYLENRLCLVSPWMENGNVMEFLRKNPDTDRLSLILDVALGLEYLHDQKIVHGDLKGINILVTPSRRACIADFGMSSIANAMTLRLTISTAPARGGTARYQAPELFQLGDEETPQTFSSDVYGFACVGYEILTDKVPFHELTNDIKVIHNVTAGKRPSRPLSCSGTIELDSLWELLQHCWDGQAEIRPSAPQIVHRLVGWSSIRATTSSETWDDKLTSRCYSSLQAQPLLPSVAQIECMLVGDEVAQACKECFPDQESSAPRNQKDCFKPEGPSKRPYEEETSDSSPKEDFGAGNPRGKRSKPSHEPSQ